MGPVAAVTVSGAANVPSDLPAAVVIVSLAPAALTV